MTDLENLLTLMARAGVEFIVIGRVVERLIQSKRAAGRPKDFEAIAELERILEQKSH